MTTNARILQGAANGSDGFDKLPSPAEAAALLSGQTKKQEEGVKPKEKLLGKFDTVEQALEGYKQLESRLGLQGQEIGQLRSLTDKLLDLKRTEDLQRGGVQKEEISSDDLLRNPREAISRVVKESTENLEQQLQTERLERTRLAFKAKHPTYETDMNDVTFKAYIEQSAYRKGLAAATVQGNVAAADELWTAYEEYRDAQQAGDKGKEKGEADRAKALRDAQMVTSGGGTTGGAEGVSSGKPIYSRLQLIDMRIRNPTAYYDDAFQTMLTEAYREKRVR